MAIKKAAVIGYPVKHSLSPVLHGYWLNKYNIDGEYGLLEVKPEDLEETLLGLKDKGYVGCNLTIPHKEAAFNIVGRYDDKAHSIGAINTIEIKDDVEFSETKVGSYNHLSATNTDAFGFIENIKQSCPSFDFNQSKAVILGAGGAARAVIFGLMECGVSEIVVSNRTKDKAYKIISDFRFIENKNRIIKGLEVTNEYNLNSKITVADWNDRNEILADANLLVNTTSLGMKGKLELDIDLEKLPKSALVTDIVYSPIEVDFDNPTYTKLLKKASKRGNFVVEGLGMLLYQAVSGFQMWFGVKPEVDDGLREHVLSHLK